jgi:hypothetical protein
MARSFAFDGIDEEKRGCECCGRTIRRFAGGVLDGDAPYAVFAAEISSGHPEVRVRLAVCLGDWSEESKPSHRRIVGLQVSRTEGDVVTGLVDAADSVLPDDEMGRLMTAAQVRAARWRGDVFELSDFVLENVPALARRILAKR